MNSRNSSLNKMSENYSCNKFQEVGFKGFMFPFFNGAAFLIGAAFLTGAAFLMGAAFAGGAAFLTGLACLIAATGAAFLAAAGFAVTFLVGIVNIFRI